MTRPGLVACLALSMTACAGAGRSDALLDGRSGGTPVGRGARSPQHPADSGRRSRLRRPQRVRPVALPDAIARSPGPRGHPLHALLLGQHGLRAIPGLAADRTAHGARVHSRQRANCPLRDEDRTIAMALRDAGYRTALVGKWGLGLPGSSGAPDRKGFEYSFGVLDQRHAHRQFTDHLFRNGESVAVDLEQGLRQRPVHARGGGLHRAAMTRGRSSCT